MLIKVQVTIAPDTHVPALPVAGVAEEDPVGLVEAVGTFGDVDVWPDVLESTRYDQRPREEPFGRQFCPGLQRARRRLDGKEVPRRSVHTLVRIHAGHAQDHPTAPPNANVARLASDGDHSSDLGTHPCGECRGEAWARDAGEDRGILEFDTFRPECPALALADRPCLDDQYRPCLVGCRNRRL